MKRWSSIALGVSWFVITLTAAASEWATWPTKKIPTWDPVNETAGLVPMTWRWYATHDLVSAATWLLGLWLVIGVAYLVGRRGARIGFGLVSLATVIQVMVGAPYERLLANPLRAPVLGFPSMINGRNALVLGVVWLVVLLLPGLFALASVPARRTSQAEIEVVALLAAVWLVVAWGAGADFSLADFPVPNPVLGLLFVAGMVGAIRGRMFLLVVGAVVVLAVLQAFGDFSLAPEPPNAVELARHARLYLSVMVPPLFSVAVGSLVPRLADVIRRLSQAAAGGRVRTGTT